MVSDGLLHQVDKGQLDASEKQQVVAQLTGKLEQLEEQLATAESEGKLKLVEKLKGMQAQLQVRLTAVRELKPILRKVKFEEEIKAAQKKLAELADPPIAALESSLALNRARQCDLRDEEAAICSQLQELRSSAKQAAAEAAGFACKEARAAGFELVYSGWLTGAVGDSGPWAWSGKSPSGIRTLATAPPSVWRGAGRWLSREPAFPFSCAQIIMTGMGSQRARTWVLVDTGSTLEGWSKRTIKSACDGGPIAALRATVQRLAATPRRPIDPRRGRDYPVYYPVWESAIWGNCRGRRVYYHRGRRALRLADSTCVASTTGVVTDAYRIRLPFFANRPASVTVRVRVCRSAADPFA